MIVFLNLFISDHPSSIVHFPSPKAMSPEKEFLPFNQNRFLNIASVLN